MPKLNTNTSIVDYLKSIGKDSDYNNRKKLADQYGISNYSGSGDQNVMLLNKLKTESTPKQSTTKEVNPVKKEKVVQPAASINPVNQTQNLANVQPVQQNNENNMPGEYNSPYTQQIDTILNQVMNRGPFSYNPENDPTYQQYQQQYTQQANLGLRDTMGEAAALSGGYGNSYGATAGQQTYDAHMSQLNNMIPELYQAAMANYQNQLNNDYNSLSALQSLENNAYGKYRDSVGDYYTDRDFNYGKERDSVADTQWQSQYDRGIYEDDRNYDYQLGRDQVGDQQWQDTFDYGKSRDKVSDSQWQQQFSYNKSQDAADNSQWERQFAYNQEQDRIEREAAKTDYLNKVAQEQSEEKAKESEQKINTYSSNIDKMLNATTEDALGTKSSKYKVEDVWSYLNGSSLTDDEIAIIVDGNYELRKYIEGLSNKRSNSSGGGRY
jgi:hypothetical protein